VDKGGVSDVVNENAGKGSKGEKDITPKEQSVGIEEKTGGGGTKQGWIKEGEEVGLNEIGKGDLILGMVSSTRGMEGGWWSLWGFKKMD